MAIAAVSKKRPDGSLKAVLWLFNALIATFFSQVEEVGKQSNSFGFCRSVNRPRIRILRSKLAFRVDFNVQSVRYLWAAECDYSRVTGSG